MFRSLLIAALFAQLALSTSSQAVTPAQCAQPDPNVRPKPGVNRIRLNPDGLTPPMLQQLNSAIAGWGQCGGSVPEFTKTHVGDMDVSIVFHDRAATPSDCGPTLHTCACFARQLANGGTTFVGGEIRIFSNNGDGVPCLGSDADVLSLLMHELGHVLGLRDIYWQDCDDRIMFGFLSGNTTMDSTDCAGAEAAALAANAGAAGAGGGGGANIIGFGDGGDNPDNVNLGHCFPGLDPWCTPLIIDLDGDGLILTSGPERPVAFDFHQEGRRLPLTWTFSGTREAFLWIDLDGNGEVSGGTELFGTASNLPSGQRARHGFAALATYDQPRFGGNGDSLISDQDLVWWELRLWVDSNHDARSQEEEVLSLEDARILALGLDFKWSQQIDASGNGHFLHGLALQSTEVWGLPAERWLAMHDVYFRLVP